MKISTQKKLKAYLDAELELRRKAVKKAILSVEMSARDVRFYRKQMQEMQKVAARLSAMKDNAVSESISSYLNRSRDSQIKMNESIKSSKKNQVLLFLARGELKSFRDFVEEALPYKKTPHPNTSEKS